MKWRATNSIRGYKRISIEIKDTAITKARKLKVLVGEVNDAIENNGLVLTNLDLGAVIGIGVGGSGNLSLEVLERVDVRVPFASVGIVVEKAFQLQAGSRGDGLGHCDIPERVVVAWIFGLTLLKLDESERIIGIGADVGLVNQLEDGRLANVLVVLRISIEEMK